VWVLPVPVVAGAAGTVAAARFWLTSAVVAVAAVIVVGVGTGPTASTHRGADTPAPSVGVAIDLAVQPFALPRPELWSPERKVVLRRTTLELRPSCGACPYSA